MNIRHVVGLSGGKDSTAMAIALMEREPRDYEFICNETGNELPEMKQHWSNLESILGKKIVKVRYKMGLIEASMDEGMLPNVFSRWCTRILKIEPTIAYFKSLPEDSVLYVGLRADEESRKGLWGDDIIVKTPMRDWGWSEADVYKFLNDHEICVPARTDCAICPYQRLGEWRNLYFNDPIEYAQGVALEMQMGHTIRSPGRDTWPASLAELAIEFERGRPLREYKRATTCRVCSL